MISSFLEGLSRTMSNGLGWAVIHMPEYKYTYLQFKGDPEIDIVTDCGINFSDIKQITIEETPQRGIRESIYQNGVAVEIEQTNDRDVLHANKELIQGSDGS